MAFNTVTEFIDAIPPRDSLTYAPSYGILALRELWRESLVEKNPSLAGKAISLPVVTNGITHGISTLADVWANPGDTIVAPDMMWGNYNMIFGVKGGATFTHYPFFDTHGGFNLSGFEQALRKGAQNNKKLIVILNFPHNPTGYTVSKDEGKAMVDILTAEAERGTHIIAACDDAYFGLFFEENTLKESLFAQLCNCHPRLLAVKLDGATKENYVWGLRVGFITYGGLFEEGAEPVYVALEKKTAGCIRGTISNASHVGQSIVYKSMRDRRYDDEKKEKFDIMKNRAQRVKAVLTDPKYQDGFSAYPFNSGYFMCIRLKTVDAEALRCHLLDKYQVGLISLGKTDLRVAFSCLEEDEVPLLFDTILKGIKELEST
jgi:aspartate/methionine/tyrosine aminotransferase